MRFEIERYMLRYRWAVVLGLAGLGWFLLFSAPGTAFRCSTHQVTAVCEGELVAYTVFNPWLGAAGGVLLCAAGLVYCHRRIP